MKRLNQSHHFNARLAFLFMFVFIFPLPCLATGLVTPEKEQAFGDHPSRANAFRKDPMRFEFNAGQVDNRIRFFSHGQGVDVLLRSDEVVLEIRRPASGNRVPRAATAQDNSPQMSTTDVHLHFNRSNRNTQVTGIEPLPGKSNYLLGKDPRKWATNVPGYSKVKYEEIYKGIEAIFYGSEGGSLEYDFLIAPGADPNQISISIQGARDVRMDPSGNLWLSLDSGEVKLLAPRVYQTRGNVTREVTGKYRVKSNGEIVFRLGHYDRKRTVVIDPRITYSTFLGGAGYNETNIGNAIAVDPAGNAVVVGTTDRRDFTTRSALQGVAFGYRVAFISKFSADGSSLMFSTYLGGSGSDYAAAVAVDPSGIIYVVGGTTSINFPLTNPIQPINRGNENIFIAKISADGATLMGSTYWGGSGKDDPLGLRLGSDNSLFIFGKTTSIDFPMVNPNQSSYGGGLSDAFLTVMGSDLTPQYSTYLGGSGEDRITAISPVKAGLFLVGGVSNSPNFASGCTGDGECPFIAELQVSAQLKAVPYGNSSWRKSVHYSLLSQPKTLAPAKGMSQFREVQLGQSNINGDIAVVVGGECAPESATGTCNSGGAIYLFDQDLNPKGIVNLGDAIPWFPTAAAVDLQGRIYVTGDTVSQGFPAVNAMQQASGGLSDAFLFVYDIKGQQLLSSTYLGGSADDLGQGVAVAAAGSIYLCGTTYSADFPVRGAMYQKLRGRSSSFVTKIGWPATTSVQSIPLSSGGSNTFSTVRASGPVEAGYGIVNVNSGNPPYGIAVFSVNQNGNIVSEVGVPASPPSRTTRAFIDYRKGVPQKSDENNAGFIDINTGIALVNAGGATANVTFKLLGPDGSILSTGHGSLAGKSHSSKFIDQLRDIALDFSFPATFSTQYQFGSLEISSDQLLSVAALRMTTNQRGEGLLTTTPIADVEQPASNLPLYFPQIADGGGYRTTINLVNTTTSMERGSLQFFKDDGSPLLIRPVNGSSASTVPYAIASGGVFVIQTDGSPSVVNVGWIKVTPDAGYSSPLAAGLFSYSNHGILVTETGVPAAIPTTHARIYIDKTSGHDTGVALANPSESKSNILIAGYEPDGTTLAGVAYDPSGLITVSGNGHLAKFVGQLLRGPQSGFTGVMDLSSNIPFVALTLRSLANSRGDVLLTTFPVADFNRPAPTPIIFPQIVDGGGYQTEFIFINATGSGSASTLNFFGNDGIPLEVGKKEQ